MTTLDASPRTNRYAGTATLSVGHTPDSDDLFNFYAWEHGHVALPGYTARFERDHICVLNHAAAAGLYHVVATSSVMYSLLADRYWILAVGNSVGRGYGPVLVSRRYHTLAELAGKRIGVADVSTTGGALARMYCPDAELVSKPYDRIGQAVLDGTVDAGVMIHEELVHFPEMGLHRVCDLGRAWSDETGLPLPVGLNLVKKSVGRATARDIARTCRDSLQWALDHQDQAMDFVTRFGRGRASEFVPMFSNDDTLCMPGDVRDGLDLLLDRVAALGFGPRPDSYEVIDA